MRVWRVSNYPDLTGVGGTLVSGRWHSRGRPILYAADHPAAAILEMLAHMGRSEIPASYRLLALDIDEAVAVAAMDAAVLPPDWRSRRSTTREIGDGWLAGGDSLLLRIPSALTPHAANYLINPRHAEMTMVRLAGAERLDLDQRLR